MNCKNCCVIACDGYGYDNEPERCEFYTRMSHGDRIRSYSDEELAEFMSGNACPPGKEVTELCADIDGGAVPDMCNLCWLKWLEEVEDDNDND